MGTLATGPTRITHPDGSQTIVPLSDHDADESIEARALRVAGRTARLLIIGAEIEHRIRADRLRGPIWRDRCGATDENGYGHLYCVLPEDHADDHAWAYYD